MAERVKLIIEADDAGAIKVLKNTNKELKGIETQTTKNQKTNKGLIGSLKNLKAGYIAMAAVVVGVVVKALKVGIKSASEFEEANSKFGVVFRGVSEEANAMRHELINAYGLSAQSATEALSTFQDFIVPMGVARGEAAKLSGAFARAAVDLSSFSDVPIEQAMNAMKSALAGQSEPLRTLGINVNEAALKTEALAAGVKLVGGRIPETARAQLLLNAIMKKGADSVGDMGRTWNSTANIMKRAGQRMDDIKLIFGQELARAIQPVVDGFGKFIQTEGGLLKIRKAIQGVFLGLKLLQIPIRFTIVPLIIGIKESIIAITGLGSILKKLANRDFPGAGEAAKKLVVGIKDDFVDVGQNYLEFGKGIVSDFKKLVSEGGEAIEGLNNIVPTSPGGDGGGEDPVVLAKKNQIEQIQALEAEATEKELLDKATKEEALAKLTTDAAEKRIAELKKTIETGRKFNAEDFKKTLAGTSQMLGDLSTLRETNSKTAFSIGKGAAIAQATIDTFSSAQSAYSAMSGIPVIGPALGIAAAAAAITAGIVRIGKIKSTKFQKAQRGGIIEPSFSGTPIIAGENNRREAIIPLEDERAVDRLGGGGGSVTINFNGDVTGGDSDEISDMLIKKIDNGLFQLQQTSESVFAENILDNSKLGTTE